MLCGVLAGKTRPTPLQPFHGGASGEVFHLFEAPACGDTGRMSKHHRIQIAACAARIRQAGSEVQLIPAGEFRARDGRPHEVPAWVMGASSARQVIARAEQRETAFVLDYEHQTLHAETSGQPAPAAAWFTRLEWREGDGLYAVDVEWTERARAMIEAGEYRYLSPVFKYDPETGEVRELIMAAVTNNPAIDGIADLAAARYLTQDDHEEESTVNEEMLKLLGLSKDASEQEMQDALAALKSQADEAHGLKEQLAAATTQTPDPSKHVPVEVVSELREQIATLSAQVQDTEVGKLVTEGLDDGRLLPSMEEWARGLGKQNVAALRSYLDSAQPIAALTSSQTGGQQPSGNASGLNDTEVAVCKQLGVSEESFKNMKESDQ